MGWLHRFHCQSQIQTPEPRGSAAAAALQQWQLRRSCRREMGGSEPVPGRTADLQTDWLVQVLNRMHLRPLTTAAQRLRLGLPAADLLQHWMQQMHQTQQLRRLGRALQALLACPMASLPAQQRPGTDQTALQQLQARPEPAAA